jgi:hypothetical protein
MSQAAPGVDAPGPGADDFNPKNHIWDGTSWWTLDRSHWWDGNRWQSRDFQPTAQPTVIPPTPADTPLQPSQPQYSPDGRFYWDGQHWVPSPQAKTAVSRLAGALVCGGAAGVIVGTFLPWLSASAAFVGTISRDLISSGDGQFLAGVAAVGGLIGLWLLLRGPSVSGGILVLLLAVVAGFILVIDYQDVSQRVANLTAGTSSMIADVGPGPYLSGLGLLVWVIGGLVSLFGSHQRASAAEHQQG